jgi:arylsulfatase A-like enzyme
MSKNHKIWLLPYLLIFCIISGCHSPSPPPKPAPLTPHPEPRHGNVLLITLDTTRADHLGCYGYPGISTPNLDALASEGIRFENAYTPCPMTFPAHSSIMTGQYPFTHGVRNNTNYSLGYDNTTIAEILSDAKYKTAAFIGSTILEGRLGLKQGFDNYYDDMFSGVEKTKVTTPWASRKAANVDYDFLNWLDNLPSDMGDSPGWFAWVHYYDPHYPYDPPEPYASKYKDNPYAGEIAYMDDALGKILDKLKEKGLYDKTLIIAVGDHGEGLGEHGEDFHSLLTYNSTLHVPLIISDPVTRGIANIDSRTVSSIDIFPTILDWCGVEKPTTPGENLFQVEPPSDSSKLETTRFLYFESMEPRISYNWAPLRGIIEGNSKYIYTVDPELYDLVSDPNEEVNIFEKNPDVAEISKNKLDLFMKMREPIQPAEATPSPEEIARLQSLGYATGGAVPTSEDDLESLANLPDIKTKMDVFDQVSSLKEAADAAFESGDYKTAKAKYIELQKFADIMSVSQNLGEIAIKENNLADALKYMRHAIDLGSRIVVNWYNLGVAYHTFGQEADAKSAWEMAVTLNSKDPINVDSYVGLALIYSGTGDWSTAANFITSARAIDATRRDLIGYEASIRYNLGSAEGREAGKIQDSDTQINQAYDLYKNFLSTGYGNLSNYYEAGQAAIHEKDYRNALLWTQKALDLVPANDEKNRAGLSDLISNTGETGDRSLNRGLLTILNLHNPVCIQTEKTSIMFISMFGESSTLYTCA